MQDLSLKTALNIQSCVDITGQMEKMKTSQVFLGRVIDEKIDI
jgi:hypothetical protein